MSQLKAVGTNPVVFFTRDGRLIEVPISMIFFDGTEVKTTWDPADTGTEDLLEWLETLARRGALKPSDKPVVPPPPPPAEACVVTAFVAGEAGNDIEVIIEPAAAGPADTVDITVRRIETYANITLTELDQVLGTAAQPGDSTGLLRVRTNAAAANRVIGPVVFAAGPPATWTIADTNPAGAPVVLEAKLATVASGFDPADFTVAVSDVQPGAAGGEQTFTLTVTWSHQELAVAAPPVGGALPAALGKFKYLVTITAPGGFKVPAPTTIKLSGGDDPVAAVAAAATLLAPA